MKANTTCVHNSHSLKIKTPHRHVSKSKNLGGRVVMRRAAAAWRRLLICQNLEGQLPPRLQHAWLL